MELISAPSKTEQIVEILRAEIRQEKIAIGSRLSSVRQLAQRFGVCTWSVSTALERLKNENFLICKHGKGVYVRNWRQSDIIEVFFLLWQQYDAEDAYRKMLMGMTYPPHLRKGFRFITRTVFDEKLDQTHLEQEIRSIDATGGINCLLVNAPGIPLKMLPKFQKLSIPVLFLGDFAFDVPPNIELNQVVGDSFLGGYRTVEFMHWQGRKKTLLLMSEDSFFDKLFLNGAMKAASDLGVIVDYRQMPGLKEDNFTRDKMQKAMESLISEIGREQISSVPMIIYGFGIERPARILGRCRNENSHPWVMPDFHHSYSQIFYDTVFSRIEEVSRNHSPARRIHLEFPLLLTDIITHQQWLYQQHFESL
jgi:DNA-binding transcriptional regulator YhcF (GntR family)